MRAPRVERGLQPPEGCVLPYTTPGKDSIQGEVNRCLKEELMGESNLVDIVANLVKEVKILQAKVDAHNDDRVRQIVQEELAVWEKRQVQRARFGEQFEGK